MSIVRGPLNASFSKMTHRMPTLEGCTRFFPRAERMIGLRPVDGGSTESSAQSSHATFSAAKLWALIGCKNAKNTVKVFANVYIPRTYLYCMDI